MDPTFTPGAVRVRTRGITRDVSLCHHGRGLDGCRRGRGVFGARGLRGARGSDPGRGIRGGYPRARGGVRNARAGMVHGRAGAQRVAVVARDVRGVAVRRRRRGGEPIGHRGTRVSALRGRRGVPRRFRRSDHRAQGIVQHAELRDPRGGSTFERTGGRSGVVERRGRFRNRGRRRRVGGWNTRVIPREDILRGIWIHRQREQDDRRRRQAGDDAGVPNDGRVHAIVRRAGPVARRRRRPMRLRRRRVRRRRRRLPRRSRHERRT